MYMKIFLDKFSLVGLIQNWNAFMADGSTSNLLELPVSDRDKYYFFNSFFSLQLIFF